MTKSELVEALAAEMGLSARQALGILDTILDTMSDAMSRGEGVELRGFGSFSIRQYGAYEGRNPKTGAHTKVKPKRLPFFKVGKGLRQAWISTLPLSRPSRPYRRRPVFRGAPCGSPSN